MQLISDSMPADQILDEISAIVDLLIGCEVRVAEVSLGWACNLDVDELWKPISVPTGELKDYIANSRAAGDYPVGEGDLWIESAQHNIEFLLCHESDIHLTTSNRSVAERLKARWTAGGIGFTETADE